MKKQKNQRFTLPEINNPKLRSLSLTHSSYANENPGMPDNERLEFLGDAIIGFLVGAFLYKHYPTFKEAELTRLRAQLVNESQLAKFARELNLGEMMQLGNGAEKNGERENPSLLSDTFEAVIGALFLDQGLDTVYSLVESLLLSVLNQPNNPLKEQGTTSLIDAKNKLQQWSLANFGQLPEYLLIGETGLDHEKLFSFEVKIAGKTYGKGTGNRKQDATKAAAVDALQKQGLL
ncbi:MAG: ribonuclease III [Microcystaceae cyanobacterium]